MEEIRAREEGMEELLGTEGFFKGDMDANAKGKILEKCVYYPF